MKSLIAAILLVGTIYSGETTQIINPKTGFVDVEIANDEVVIHNRFIQADLEKNGIAIPDNLRSHYAEKAFVHLSDPLFKKAFCEVYTAGHPELVTSQVTANQ